MRPSHAALLACTLFAADAPAQDTAKPDAKPDAKKESVTRQTVTIGGTPVEYVATAGTLPLKEDDGKVKAEMFYVAYTKPGADPLKRPITFTFNGGPGSSSVWLHMGAFGPKRVVLTDEGEATPPPYKIVDNDLSLLDLTDLVFIDPVSTGFSRAADPKDAKLYHGVTEDIAAVGDFIRLYCVRNGRWSSPKFLAGESYGTTRSAGLSGYLQDRHGMNLNGIVLVSSILNFQTARFDEGNDLPYPMFLPSFAATAWYHKKLPTELQSDLRKTLKEVEEFAAGEYTLALMKGDKLPPEERKKVAAKLARYTGLSPEYVEQTNLRVDIMRFTKELLRGDRRTVGRYDSRLKGTDLDAAGERPEYDPSYAAVQGAYTAALNTYLRSGLKYESDLPYEILTGKVQPWEYGPAKNRYLNTAPTLRKAMTTNRNLKLFVASGYYDLATPFFATDYTLAHLGLDGEPAKNVTVAYYEAGHMMYIHRPSHEKLKKDLAAFYKSAAP